MELFCKTLRTRKFLTGKFFGVSTHGILMHSGFRKCIWKLGTTNVWPCFGRPKLGECDKMRSVSKNMRCPKKQARPQFSKYRFQNESAASPRLWADADSLWKWYFENWGRACEIWHRIYRCFLPKCQYLGGRGDGINSYPCPYFTKCFPLQLFDFFGVRLTIYYSYMCPKTDFTQEKESFPPYH